jgi:hypothetical protein
MWKASFKYFGEEAVEAFAEMGEHSSIGGKMS